MKNAEEEEEGIEKCEKGWVNVEIDEAASQTKLASIETANRMETPRKISMSYGKTKGKSFNVNSKTSARMIVDTRA